MKHILLFIFAFFTTAVWAQTDIASDAPFKAYIYNNVYDVYLKINLYDSDITVPGHDIYGELPGYLRKTTHSYSWLITGCKIKSKHQVELTLINDTGSEDLIATLTVKNDSTYVLKQGKGSTLKVPNKGKWQKLPAEVVFIKRVK